MSRQGEEEASNTNLVQVKVKSNEGKDTEGSEEERKLGNGSRKPRLSSVSLDT
jgi:hypothetical protein